MTHLLAALWQGLALVFGVAAALRVSRRVSAATQYAIWWATLVAVAALTTVHAARAWADEPDALAVPLASSHAAAPVFTLPSVPAWAATALGALWIASTLWSFSRLVAALLGLRRLRRAARPLASNTVARLSLWNQWRGLPGRSRAVRLSMSDAVPAACAVGLSRRPLVILSPKLVQTLPAETLDHLVLHEWVHLLRYDDWSQFLQACVMVLFGAHPAMRFVNRRLETAREMACDDRVVAISGSARAYACSLASAAEAAAGMAWRPRLVPNASGRGTLLIRVRSLLEEAGNRRPHLSGPAVAVSAIALAAATVGGAALDPVVVVASRSHGAGTPAAVRSMTAEDIAAFHPGRMLPAAVQPSAPDAEAATVQLIPPGIKEVPQEVPPVRADRRPGTARGRSVPQTTGQSTLVAAGQVASTSPEAPPASDVTTLESRTLAVRVLVPSSSEADTTAWPSGAAIAAASKGWALKTAPLVAATTSAGAAVADRATRVGVSTGSASDRAGRAIGRFFARSASRF